MTLPPYTRTRKGEVHSLGHGREEKLLQRSILPRGSLTRAHGTVMASHAQPNGQLIAHRVGNGNLYGSVLSSKFTDTGGANIHYDTSLMTSFKTLGNFVQTSFTWKKY